MRGSCLTDATIQALLEGSLSQSGAAHVDDHIEACADCRGLVADAARCMFTDGARRGATLVPGDRVERYEIQEIVGLGGMSVVYAAWDRQLGRRVALKLLRPGLAQAQPLQEARALARVSHPNVVAVYDAGMFGAEVFLAMELVQGETLARWLRARTRPWREVLRVLLEAGRGLTAAHDAGLVHRDFKPHNVLIGADGRVRVTDFGLARFGGGEPEAPGSERTPRGGDLTRLTRTSVFVGTPAYMAPEQLTRGEASPLTDQFGFCVTAYEAFYGERPFGGDTLESLTDAVCAGRLCAAPSRSRVPARLRSVLMRGLRVQAPARHASMKDLLAQLERAARRRVTPVLGVGVALAAAAVLAAIALGAGPPSAPARGGTRSGPVASASAAPTANPTTTAHAHAGERDTSSTTEVTLPVGHEASISETPPPPRQHRRRARRVERQSPRIAAQPEHAPDDTALLEPPWAR